MLVPAPPEVDGRQTSGLTVKHDQISIWKTIRSETKLYLQNHAPIISVAPLRENQQKKELTAPALAKGIPKVVALNAGTRCSTRTSKPIRKAQGNALALHLSPEQPKIRR